MLLINAACWGLRLIYRLDFKSTCTLSWTQGLRTWKQVYEAIFLTAQLSTILYGGGGAGIFCWLANWCQHLYTTEKKLLTLTTPAASLIQYSLQYNLDIRKPINCWRIVSIVAEDEVNEPYNDIETAVILRWRAALYTTNRMLNLSWLQYWNLIFFK